jgi:hypothetical protein
VKPKNTAAWEFILFDAKALYEAKLHEFRREQKSAIDPHDEQTPAYERAYKAVLQEMKARSIDWVTLRNLLSLRRREPGLFVGLEVPDSDLIPSQAGGSINDNATMASSTEH